MTLNGVVVFTTSGRAVLVDVRAETRMLIPIEYTAFVWAALGGWLFFNESLTLSTVAGTTLIVLGCVIAARH